MKLALDFEPTQSVVSPRFFEGEFCVLHEFREGYERRIGSSFAQNDGSAAEMETAQAK